MATQNWIPLIEYSSRYNISLSTLRRRIKTHSILFKLENGKYFILDDSSQLAPTVAPTSESKINENPIESPAFVLPDKMEASVLASANRLVEELKAAYAKILQEKEVQIGLLKEQILDLNMLVNLLEKQSEAKISKANQNEGKTFGKESSPNQEEVKPLDVENFYFPEIEI
jgi:hypothetical protein